MTSALVVDEPYVARPEKRGCRLAVDVDGGLVRLRARYDSELVAQIRTLPGRRFIRERAEWVLPARREALAQVAALVDALGDGARATERARRRLDRVRPGRIESRHGQFELSFPYDPRRLARVRSIPERGYQRARRRWMVAPTRAGALALLALVEQGEFTAEPDVAVQLARLAATQERARSALDDTSGGEPRTSPVPHWRHVTRGAIFEANLHRHEWVEGIGWCVRVRVDPARRRGQVR